MNFSNLRLTEAVLDGAQPCRIFHRRVWDRVFYKHPQDRFLP